MKYVLFREDFELSVKINPDRIIDEAFNTGVQNGEYDTLGTYDNIHDANEALTYYSCNVEKINGRYYSLEMFYWAEIDDNGDQTGNYSAAEIMRYLVRDSITEEVFDAFSDIGDAYFAINAYEEVDKKYHNFMENAYEVYDTILERTV